MKPLVYKLVLFIAVCYIQTSKSQISHNHSHLSELRTLLPVLPSYVFSADSLMGFDQDALNAMIVYEHLSLADAKRLSYIEKRRYIDSKYALGIYSFPKPKKAIQKRNTIQSGINSLNCTAENFNFEDGTGNGWNLSGNTSIVSSGTDPYGGFPWVYPGGGSYSLKISADNNSNGKWGQATKSIAVPAAGVTLFTFHFAMAIFNYPHPAFAAAKFHVDFFDGNNNQIACPKYECYHSTDNGDVGVNNFVATANPASFYNPSAEGDGPGTYNVTTSNWNDVTLDLTGYAGQTITARFRIDWCVPDVDWAYCLVDADCPVFNFQPIPVCGGVGSPVCGPPNMATYSWTTTTGAVSTSSCITPASSGIYTLEVTPMNVQCSAAPTIKYLYDVMPNPSADFNYTVTPCQSSLSVPFDDNSTLNGGAAITSYTWNWGDTTPDGTLNNETHTFTSAGPKTVTLTVSNGTCENSISKNFNISLKPIAGFSADAVCQGFGNTFTDLSTVTAPDIISSWDWDYNGDAVYDNTFLVSTPTHSNMYATSGNFNAKLKITSSSGCQDQIVVPVDVWGHSIPNFNVDNVCYGTGNTFNNTTNIVSNANVGNISTYIWDFGDGTPTATVTDPNHIYMAGGNLNSTYNVTLTAITNHNCSDFTTQSVNVFALPTAAFTSNSVCLGAPSGLTDASNGNGNPITNYQWDYLSDYVVDVNGVSNTTHIFPAFGNNSVTYIITTTPVNGLTCSTSTTQNVWVNPNPLPNFTFLSACVNDQPLNFDASLSAIAIGTNTMYTWAYGDATNTSSNTSTSTHSYSTSGIYNVTLTVSSDNGCQTSITEPVEVYKKPLMAVSNSSACDTKVMTFTASAIAGSGNIVDWFWDFDNNATTLEASGKHSGFIFPSAGSQTINLVAVTDNGCRDVLLKTVYVDYVPKPLFSIDNPSGCSSPHCVTFTDNTLPITGPEVNAQWKWFLGDGTVINAVNNGTQTTCYTNNSFSQSAQFDVKLVVTTSKGCVDSIIKPALINVYPKPMAQYTVNPNPSNVVTPLVYFTNESQGYTKWWWHFGDSPIRDSVNVDPTHFYSSVSADSYNSVLIVQNQYGCLDTAFVKIDVGPEFTFYIPNAFTPGEEDNINATFTGKGIGIVKYEMWVYDRWGATIFYTDEISRGWDGKVQGKSTEAQQDVYVWKVKLKDVFGKAHDYVGHVTLLR